MSNNNPWTAQTPLSNADFKALLATPRPDWSSGGSGSAARGGSAQQQQQRAAAAKKDKPFKPPKPKPKPAAQEEDEDGPKYRCKGGPPRCRAPAHSVHNLLHPTHAPPPSCAPLPGASPQPPTRRLTRRLAAAGPTPHPRDRAKERRQGVNFDYEGAEAELEARGIRPEALGGLSIADSKFLGGDMAHTHLVKGLDYALLQQVRAR
jgi:hypothetical protein